MKKRRGLCILLCMTVIGCFTVASFGATKSYTKNMSTMVTVIDGGTFNIDVKLGSTHTYTDTSTKRKFTKQDYNLVATTTASPYYKNKVNVTMGILQYYPGGTRCPQDPNIRVESWVDPSWLAHRRTVSTTTKSVDLNSSAYCTLGWMAAGLDVVYTKSGTAKWTGIANK